MGLHQTNRGTETNNPEGEEKQLKDFKRSGIRFVFQKHLAGGGVENATAGSQLRGATVMTQVRADDDGVYQAGQTREGR